MKEVKFDAKGVTSVNISITIDLKKIVQFYFLNCFQLNKEDYQTLSLLR